MTLFTSTQQFLNQFKSNDIAIYISTQEDYNQLMQFFDLHDIKWCDGLPATQVNDFSDCSNFCVGFCKKENGLVHCEVECYLNDNYTIIPYTQIKSFIEDELNKHSKINKKLKEFNDLYNKFKQTIPLLKQIADLDCEHIRCSECPFNLTKYSISCLSEKINKILENILDG